MHEDRHFNRVVAGVLAGCVLLTLVFMFAPAAIGVTAASYTLGYETLFDPDHVMRVEVTVDDAAWQNMLENASAEEYIQCDVKVDGHSVIAAGIRPKGNSSLQQVASDPETDRVSFKLEFDQYVKKQTLLGLDKMALNNMHQDATYMKEYLSYMTLRDLGVATPLFCFAQIYVNGEPWGLYLAVEALEDSYAVRAFGTTHGALYKPESMGIGEGGMGGGQMMQNAGGEGGQWPAMPEGGFQMPEGFTLPEGFSPPEGFTPPEGGMPTDFAGLEGVVGDDAREQRTFAGGMGGGMGGRGQGDNLVYTDDSFDSYSTVFDGTVFQITDADKRRLIASLKTLGEGEDVAQVLDVDANLAYIAANVALVNLDSYFSSMCHNYYLYEKNGKLTMLPWDYNLSFAGFQSSDAKSAVHFAVDSATSGVELSQRPVIEKLLAEPAYLEQYHELLTQIATAWTDGTMAATIDRLDAMIQTYVENDPTAFCTYDEYRKAVETLKEYCVLRGESILGQIEGTLPATTAAQSENAALLTVPEGFDLAEMSVSGGMMGMRGNGDNAQRGNWQANTRATTPEAVAADAEALPSEKAPQTVRDAAQATPSATNAPSGNPQGMAPPGASGRPSTQNQQSGSGTPESKPSASVSSPPGDQVATEPTVTPGETPTPTQPARAPMAQGQAQQSAQPGQTMPAPTGLSNITWRNLLEIGAAAAVLVAAGAFVYFYRRKRL